MTKNVIIKKSKIMYKQEVLSKHLYMGVEWQNNERQDYRF